VGKNAARSLLDDFSTGAPYVTEARRVLQKLMRQQREGECSVYMLTSAARGEGKSTICALLAIVAARVYQRRVLLIDADLRRPTLHGLLDVPAKPGLFEHLQRTGPVELVCRPTWIPTLQIIPSGRGGPAANEAYDDERFAALIASLRPSYDMIFVDAGPVVPLVEPIMMAEHVDGLLLVAMAGKTPVPMVRRMKEILTPVASKIMGVLVNNSAEGLPYYYDYAYYGYTPHEARRPGEKVEPPRGPSEPASRGTPKPPPKE
jgi:capsular exopolysaccharide synthesis family protein